MNNRPRNLAIHLPEDRKKQLKELAYSSGLTMTQYVEAVVNEALDHRAIFKILTRRIIDERNSEPAEQVMPVQSEEVQKAEPALA